MLNRMSNFYLKMLVLLSKKLYLCSDFQEKSELWNNFKHNMYDFYRM